MAERPDLPIMPPEDYGGGDGDYWPPYEDPGGDGRRYTGPGRQHIPIEDVWPDLVDPGPGDYRPETVPVTENEEIKKMKLWLWALIIAGVLYFMNQ